MTAIGAFELKGVPFVVGDLLFTTRKDGEDHLQLPTFEDMPTVLEGCAFRTAWLARKTLIVHDQLCLAFSGYHTPIGLVIRELKALAGEIREESDLRRALKNIIGDYPTVFTEGQYFVAVGWIVRKTPVCFRWDSRLQKLKGGRDDAFEGTGCARLIAIRDKHPRDDPPGLETTVSYVVAGIADLLVKESLTGFGLDEASGGGYSIAYFDGVRFQYVPRIFTLYSSWKYKGGPTWGWSFPDHFIEIANFPEYTVIKSMRGEREPLEIEQVVVRDEGADSPYGTEIMPIGDGYFVCISVLFSEDEHTALVAASSVGAKHCDLWTIDESRAHDKLSITVNLQPAWNKEVSRIFTAGLQAMGGRQMELLPPIRD